MVLKAKDLGFIEGVDVGSDRVNISHLQFVDNTLILCPTKDNVLMNYRHLLDYFFLSVRSKD